MIGAAAALFGMMGPTLVAPPPSDAAAAIDAGLRTCEAWLLKPQSWADDPAAFLPTAGLADTMTPQTQVPDIALPPPGFRDGMHHFRAPLGDGGVLVTTSQVHPICHVVGGGPNDMQPGVTDVMASASFATRWTAGRTERSGDMATSVFVSRADPKLTMTVSRAVAPGGRGDRVQLVATAQYQVGN